MDVLWWLLLIGGLVWAWQDYLRARERAIAVAVETCRQSGVQLLDSTVALARVRPAWTGHGLRLKRTFVFDYSRDGADRLQGFIVFTGHRPDTVGMADESRFMQ